MHTFNKFLLSSLSILVLVACNKTSTENKRLADTPTKATAIATIKKPTRNKDAVRILNSVPKFELTNQRNESIDNSDLYGRVWVANFIFTQCQGICPLQTAKMLELQNSLKRSNRWDDMRLVSFSVDPETDTPQALSEYINSKSLETSQWQFLTGTRDELWDLSKNGFKLPVTEDAQNTKMPILHSAQFVLVDWEGRIRGYYDSLNEKGYSNLKRDLASVVNERMAYPSTVINSSWVKQRQEQQIASAKNSEIFNDFTFKDTISESGITFKHKIVDDAGIAYKAVHYDHGNAVAIADVDSDGLLDIYFSTQVGSNELWRNLGNGQFENITKKSGLFVDDRIGVGASFADIDNDGDQDLYTTSVRIGNQLFENDGKGHFKNITNKSNTGVKAHSSGSVFFDYDRDGLLDLFVSNVGVYTEENTQKVSLYTQQGQKTTDYNFHIGFNDAFAGHLKAERTETSVLFKNMGNNTFQDVSKKVNLVDTSWTGEANVIDGNNDGWPDLYIHNMQGNDEYYENQQGQSFVRKSRDVFPKTPWGAMGSKTFDFDNDGDMDIFITDMHSDMSKDVFGADEKRKSDISYTESFLQSDGNSLFGNAFYRNESNGQFTEISDQINAETYWPWGLGTGDVNADGFEDVFITAGMNYPFRYAPNSLLLNNQGLNFVDSEYILGVEPRKNGLSAAPSFDLDCSGENKSHLLCKDETGRRVIWGALGSRSSVIFDLDQDGDQDIVTLEFNHAPMVLISDLSDKKNINYIKINLEGTQSNKSGIGATVKVFAGNDIYTKIQDGKSGYLAQSFYPLYFGLGDNKKINKIEVNWPSGNTQTYSKNIEINQTLNLTESK